MFSCAVYGCTNDSLTSDPSVNYYSFPKSTVAVQQWIQACGWQSDLLIDLDLARICSIHFDESAYNTEIKMVNFTACYSKTLRSDAVPTLYLPQTQIIIKDPMDASSIKSVVVYTVNSTTSSDGITTVCLPDTALTKQFFQIQPSTSDIKIETQSNSVKIEVVDNAEHYSLIRTYPDLYVLQANNKSLKMKNEALEKEISNLEKILSIRETEHAKLEKQCRILEAQKTNKSMSQQEQKMLLSKVFSESQIKILFGKKKLYWNNDDIAVGYTIRHLSNKRCYAYLTKTLNIPLPAVSSIKRWVTTRKIKAQQNSKKKQEQVAA